MVEAAEKGDALEVQKLVKKGLLQPNGDTAQTALFAAGMRDQVEAVKALLDWGTPLQGYGGNQPIHVGARAGAPGVVALLIARQADFLAPDPGGRTPMTLAIKAPSMPTVKILLRAGAEVEPGEQAPGLAATLREYALEKLTNDLRKMAKRSVSSAELAKADEKVWQAQREHMRLISLKEEQRAGSVLISLEERLVSEKEAAEKSKERESQLTYDLNELRVKLQTVQTSLTQLATELEAARKEESTEKEKKMKLDAELKEKQLELNQALEEKAKHDETSAEKAEARDAALQRCRAMDDDIQARRTENDMLSSELQAAKAEFRAWQRNKEAAAALTAQAHRLLGSSA